MAHRIVKVGNGNDVQAQVKWAEENGLRAGHIRSVFVDLTDRVIFANHVATDDEHADSDFPPLILGRKYGIGSVPIDQPESDILSVFRQWPLLVEPPEEIIV